MSETIPARLHTYTLARLLELDTPLLVDASYLERAGLLSRELAEQAAKNANAKTLEEVLAYFEGLKNGAGNRVKLSSDFRWLMTETKPLARRFGN